MLQHAKIIRSRDEWRLKAVQRAEDLREQRSEGLEGDYVVCQLAGNYPGWQ